MYSHLNNIPFNLIKSGSKTLELRVNDEKRRSIKIGDLITFENRESGEILVVIVKKLHKYDTFQELYKHFDKTALGYKDDEIANYQDMEKYYSIEEQNKYGVVGIEFELMRDINESIND